VDGCGPLRTKFGDWSLDNHPVVLRLAFFSAWPCHELDAKRSSGEGLGVVDTGHGLGSTEDFQAEESGLEIVLHPIPFQFFCLSFVVCVYFFVMSDRTFAVVQGCLRGIKREHGRREDESIHLVSVAVFIFVLFRSLFICNACRFLSLRQPRAVVAMDDDTDLAKDMGTRGGLDHRLSDVVSHQRMSVLMDDHAIELCVLEGCRRVHVSIVENRVRHGLEELCHDLSCLVKCHVFSTRRGETITPARAMSR
jgi:hypothetical protein